MNIETIKEYLPNLHLADTSDKDFFVGGIDYSRPLDEYPTAQDIADFLRMKTPKKHIYTASLNVGGVVVQDDMEKYLSNKGIASSALKSSLKTPLHYHFSRSEEKEALNRIKGEAGYFNLGTFLHQAVLEPTKFDRVVVEPKFGLNTSAGVDEAIEWWEKKYRDLEAVLAQSLEDFKREFILENINDKRGYIKSLKEATGIECVSEENYIKIIILKKHLDNYGGGVIKDIITHSKREVSMYYKDPESGLDLKIRPDAIQFEENIGVNAIISVKSSGAEDLRTFYSQCAKLHYDLTEGMYQEIATACTGRDFNTTIMIMLQTVEPYAVAILVWDAEDIEMGKYKYKYALNNVMEIRANKVVKGYDALSELGNSGLINMKLPTWNQQELLPQNISAKF